jgi:hypothetical protein
VNIYNIYCFVCVHFCIANDKTTNVLTIHQRCSILHVYLAMPLDIEMVYEIILRHQNVRISVWYVEDKQSEPRKGEVRFRM